MILEPAGGDGVNILTRFIELVLSAAAGAVVTLVAFKTRLALIDRELELRKADLEQAKELNKSLVLTLERALDERLDMIERRQTETLRIIASIAKAIPGAENGFADAVIRMLDEGRS